MHKWVLKELADLTVRPPRIILQMSPRSGEAADDREKANVAPVVKVGQERDLGTAGRSASPQSSGMGWDGIGTVSSPVQDEAGRGAASTGDAGGTECLSRLTAAAARLGEGRAGQGPAHRRRSAPLG